MVKTLIIIMCVCMHTLSFIVSITGILAELEGEFCTGNLL